MKIKFFAAVAMAFLVCASVFAQPGPDAGKNHNTRLTEEQKAKMKEIKIATYKEISPLKNQLGELKAKQKTLVTADKPDMGEINSNIDDIAKLQAKIAKIRTAAMVQVRSLLTDEQKMIFDSRKGEKSFKNMHQNRGFRPGMQHMQNRSMGQHMQRRPMIQENQG